MGLMRYILNLRRLRFVQDVFTIQLGTSLFMLAGFLASIAYARFLGKEQYGFYAVVLAFAGTVGAFFNIGQGQSLYVFFSEAWNRKDKSAMAAVIANYVQIGIVNMFALGVLCVLMPMLSQHLYHDPTIGNLARIYCVFQMTEIWNGMSLIMLQSLRKIRLKVWLEQSANLLTLGSAVTVLALGGGVRGMLLTQLAVGLIAIPVFLLCVRSHVRETLFPSIRDVLHTPFRQSVTYLKEGLLIIADKMIYNFFPQGIFFILSLFVRPKVIGMLRIALQIANIPRTILLPQAGDLSTVAFAKMKTESVTVIRKNAARLIKHGLALHALLTAGAAALAPFVILKLYGVEFADAIMPTEWLLLILLITSLHLTSSPLMRLYRKLPLSIAIGLLNWICMIAVLFVMLQWTNGIVAFLSVYLVFELVPLLLPVYIYGILLPKEQA